MNYQINYELLSQWILDKQFFLQYQPIVNTQSLKIEGFESLIRLMWHDKIITPNEMEEWLNEAPFSAKILYHVCEMVYDDLTKRYLTNLEDCFFSVNCPASLFGTGIVPVFFELTQLSTLSRSFMIEILEDHDTPTNIFKNLNNVKNFYSKYLVSLDDLKITEANLIKPIRYPLTHIKLHQDSLRLPQNDLNFAVKHWHDLGYKIIAEFVETEQDYQKIKEAQVDLFQGWYFSKPGGLSSFTHISSPTLIQECDIIDGHQICVHPQLNEEKQIRNKI